MARISRNTRIKSRLFFGIMGLWLVGSFIWLPVLPAQSNSTTVERFILQGTDDAGNTPTSCSFTTADDNIYFGECDNGDEIASGFRFQDIPIASPDDIQAAHITFTVDGLYENDIHLRFYGEAADNSQTFGSNSKPSDRTLTTASVDWVLTSADVWNYTEKHDSPDLTPILKEIVGRPGWSSGNAISIIVKNVSSNSSHRRVFGFERETTATRLMVSIPHPIQNDLTVGWIHRAPEIDYVWDSSDPAVEGWPAVGQEVTWQAVVKNWSATALQDVPYAWFEDGSEVASGSVDIAANDTVSVDYAWPWTFERHELQFVIDPDDEIAEDEEENNSLLIYTNAITVGFYVEQSLYDYFREYQYELGVHSTCWENWAQRQVSRWNDMFANAIYDETPDGVLDRIRLDKITVVADGALPLAGGLPTNNPNLDDETVDLQWGFPSTHLDSDFYKDHTTVSDDNAFYFEGSLIHELGHARYLIDNYGFNVHDDGNGSTVAMMEDGALIVGTPYMPFVAFDALYYTEQTGLMDGDYTRVDQYSAIALNLIAGHRAIRGNYNAPENIGEFLNRDLPDENRLTVKDGVGNILANASIEVYRSSGVIESWYGKYYDDVPDLELTSDENGRVLLGRCPFDEDGTIEHGYGQANGTLIIRVEKPGQVGYAFLEATRFNIEYWRGHTTMGEYEIAVNLQGNPVPVELVSFEAHVSENAVTLDWSTASESNNFGFEIQRSPDQSDFEKIGFVPGHQTTTTPHSYRFRDIDLPVGIYYYRLKQIDADGAFDYSPIAEVRVGVPATYRLSQNFPNPFNPETTIKYQLPEGGPVLLRIYNVLGQEIRTLVHAEQPAGYHSVKWDGEDEQGRRVTSGVYVYLLRANDFASSRKMLVVQ